MPLTIPNLLTLLRFALIPAFLATYAQGYAVWAVALFAIASLTDILDGLVARYAHQGTAAGAVLDPIADKLLVFSALVMLYIRQILPLWFVGLMVVQEVVMLSGMAALRYHRVPVEIHPTRMGKYATFFLVVTVVLGLLVDLGWHQELLFGLAQVAALTAAVLVVVATVQYVRVGVRSYCVAVHEPKP